MMDLFQSSDKRINDGIEGFGHSTSTTNFNFNSIDSPGSIGQGKSVIVGCSLCSGLFSQDKFLPFKHAPIVIELELVGNPGDCLNTGSSSTVANSTSWKITEPQIKCDIVMLDSELQNSYASHLLSGKSLPIHFSSYATNVQTATGKDNSLSIARSFTRIRSVFVTMFHGDGTDVNDKVANYFYHPMNATYNKDAEVEFQLQLGSAVYPQYPIRSLAEAFYSLRTTLGITSSGSVNTNKRFSCITSLFSQLIWKNCLGHLSLATIVAREIF